MKADILSKKSYICICINKLIYKLNSTLFMKGVFKIFGNSILLRLKHMYLIIANLFVAKFNSPEISINLSISLFV